MPGSPGRALGLAGLLPFVAGRPRRADRRIPRRHPWGLAARAGTAPPPLLLAWGVLPPLIAWPALLPLRLRPTLVATAACVVGARA